MIDLHEELNRQGMRGATDLSQDCFDLDSPGNNKKQTDRHYEHTKTTDWKKFK